MGRLRGLWWGLLLLALAAAAVAMAFWPVPPAAKDPETGVIAVPTRGFRQGMVRGVHGVYVARLESGEFRAYSPVDPYSGGMLAWFEPTMRMRWDWGALRRLESPVFWEGDRGRYFAVPRTPSGIYGIDGACLRPPCGTERMTELVMERDGGRLIIYPESGSGGSAPRSLQRIWFNDVKQISDPGLYVVDLGSGAVESWLRPGAEPGQDLQSLSEDGRWLTVHTVEQIYLADRETGRVSSWSPQEQRLAAAWGGQFLFERRDEPRTLYVADSTLEPGRELAVELGERELTQAQFSPDGGTLALTAGRWSTPGGDPNPRVYVVDLQTGAVREIGELDHLPDGRLVGVELLGPATDQLVISRVVQVVEPSGLTREHSFVRRYSWQGELLAEFRVLGRAGRLSPNGQLLLVGQDLGHLASATIVADLASGQPRFRVAGASGQEWTADSASLILSDRSGGQYLVTAAGELKQAPAGDGLLFMSRLTPAPGAPDRFLAGLSVVDEAGRILQRVELPTREDWPLWSAGWGATAGEVWVEIKPPVGKGNLGWDLPLAPKVQRPPFADPYLLQVEDEAGECLNLRESFSRTGRVIRCLPTGARLAVADLLRAPVKLNQAFTYEEDQFWLWVRTEEWEVGWVSLSSGSVRFID